MAYGEPGIGASGWPRSYESGDTWKRSLEIERRRVCRFDTGVGEEFGEGVVCNRADECERRRALESRFDCGLLAFPSRSSA